MEKENVRPRLGISRVLAVFSIVVVMMVSMVLPAFAMESDVQYIDDKKAWVLEENSTIILNSDTAPIYLYVDEKTPLTVRFFMEHPEYSVIFDCLSSTNTNMKMVVRVDSGNSATVDGSGTYGTPDLKYDDFDRFYKDEKYYDCHLYIEPYATESTDWMVITVLGKPIPPSPLNVFKNMFGYFLPTFNDAVSFIASHSLILVGVGLTIVAWVFSKVFGAIRGL